MNLKIAVVGILLMLWPIYFAMAGIGMSEERTIPVYDIEGEQIGYIEESELSSLGVLSMLVMVVGVVIASVGFWSNPKVKARSELEAEKSKTEAEKFKQSVGMGVTRFDFYDAVLQALLDAHPKCKKHPALIEFRKRVELARKKGL